MLAVVLGAKGTLGMALTTQLPLAGIQVVAAPGHAECDITSAGAIQELVERWRPDVLFNAAGFTDVDGAELHADEAYRVNALAPELLARACEARGARLVHYS